MAQHETDILIKLSISIAEFKKLAKDQPIKAANHLGPELRQFEQWMMSRGMEPLSRVELAIVREYLGFKLVA